ncbi:MAG: T6SS effector BTH_I2691 family protein, partial [Shewanella oncorhynchi]
MADKKSTPSCEYCDKRGVPILPLRYAIALPKTGAPVVTNKPSIDIPEVAGQYTLRTLRSGYLNVYDEARKHWDHYFVTPEGYFFKLNATPGTPAVFPKKPFNCPDESHRAIASCITIPNAKKATNVWLAFSDVQWTAAVQKQHEAADYRKQHMRCVDVKAYTASVDAKHCLPIKDVSSKVIEYVLDKSASKKAIGFSPFLADDRKGKSQRLIEECERLAPGKAFAVVVADAPGIAAELDHLMTQSASDFANHRDRKHPLMISSAILQVKDALYPQTYNAEENAANFLADEEERNPYSALSEKQLEKLRTVTPAQVRTATDNAWKTKYRTKFNEDAMEKWQEKFKAEDKDFQEKIITPLAKALIAWLDSAP